jgi:hypothetical protein
MIFFMDHCRAIFRTLPMLQHDPNNVSCSWLMRLVKEECLPSGGLAVTQNLCMRRWPNLPKPMWCSWCHSRSRVHRRQPFLAMPGMPRDKTTGGLRRLGSLNCSTKKPHPAAGFAGCDGEPLSGQTTTRHTLKNHLRRSAYGTNGAKLSLNPTLQMEIIALRFDANRLL